MKKRVLIAGFRHETNTFSRLSTDLAAFEARLFHRRADIPRALGATRTEVAAFLNACDRHGWTPVPAIAADATPSGCVTQAAFDTIVAEIFSVLDEEPVDALLLALHGAMVTEGSDDGEGDLLAMLRGRVGPDVPIAVALDMHANVTEEMARHADIMVSYRTYPHVDQWETANEVADLLARQLAGEIRPCCTVTRGPMLDAVDHGRTAAPGPMREVLDTARGFMARPGVLSIGINAGFPWADTEFTGPTVVVVSDGSPEPHADIGAKLIDVIWETRHRRSIHTFGADEAVQAALSADPKAGPVVLADFADNPGGGGYGDSTGLLRAMLEAGAENAAFGTIFDPDAAKACTQAGEGAEVTLCLGGKHDVSFGAPLKVTGVVTRLTDGRLTFDGPMRAGLAVDMGPTAVLQVAGVAIIVTSRRFQVYDRQIFLHAGIDPREQHVFAVKSAQHFRAAFEDMAQEVIVVDEGGGLTSANFRQLAYHRVRRPVYPLDLD